MITPNNMPMVSAQEWKRRESEWEAKTLDEYSRQHGITHSRQYELARKKAGLK